MKKIFLYLSLFFLTFSLLSQNKVILEIGDHKINSDEFLYFFSKNNNEKTYSYDELKSYMDLFIKFKMKVSEAEDLKMDTSKNFVNELNGYRSKSAERYLTDEKNEEEAVREYYDRMCFDINSSHILIEFLSENKEDTIDVYNKIWSIYRELQKGADFETLAIENSQDKSVAFNKGNLGYSSVDQYVYSFENAMYNTPVGQYSEPFKTNFGYHIVKVLGKTPSKGKYKVAHIMKVTPEGISENDRNKVKNTIYAIYDSIQNNKISFEDATKKYSEDSRTASNKGEIGWVEMSSRYIPQFKNAVFSLNNIGDITIAQTNYGFHILKLLDKEERKPYEEVKNEILAKIKNTIRTKNSKTLVLERLKKDYNLKINKENLEAIHSLFNDSLFKGTLVIDNIENYDKPIITFADQVYYQKDFINYMIKYNRRQNSVPLKSFISQKEKIYVDDLITKYEETQLEDKFPEFKHVMLEYHDGILLFQLSDEKIWSKAIRDTTGLEKFYNENKFNYMWNFRYKVKKYECKNTKIAKSLQKLFRKNTSTENILAKLNAKDSSAVIVIEKYFAEKNNDKKLDNYIAKYNIPEIADYSNSVIEETTEKPIVITFNTVEPETKELSETRGIVTADYQKLLEDQWIKDLYKKYNVVIHDDVLKSLIK